GDRDFCANARDKLVEIMNDSKSNATGAGVSAVAAVVPPGLLGSRRLADGRILIPPPPDAARRKGTQRLRCSMGRCSRRGSLKAVFRWWYQDAPPGARSVPLRSGLSGKNRVRRFHDALHRVAAVT